MQLHPIFYVEKVKERLENGSLIEMDPPIHLKDDEIFKHMKHIHELDVVHKYFKCRGNADDGIP